MVGFLVCCFITLALATSHIIFDKGNHYDSLIHINFALLISLPFYSSSGNRSVNSPPVLRFITYCQLIATVNTFTEHHGGGWSFKKDMQHTFVFRYFWHYYTNLQSFKVNYSHRILGVLCTTFLIEGSITGWTGGILGIYLSRNNQVRIILCILRPF